MAHNNKLQGQRSIHFPNWNTRRLARPSTWRCFPNNPRLSWVEISICKLLAVILSKLPKHEECFCLSGAVGLCKHLWYSLGKYIEETMNFPLANGSIVPELIKAWHLLVGVCSNWHFALSGFCIFGCPDKKIENTKTCKLDKAKRGRFLEDSSTLFTVFLGSHRVLECLHCSFFASLCFWVGKTQ